MLSVAPRAIVWKCLREGEEQCSYDGCVSVCGCIEVGSDSEKNIFMCSVC